ncbi:unnamed protein product [Ceutorhynchus assimilis]|uniref:Uncharacterized protein n=1 Tax=Ceutorhynchus assimilis TaxID=467358 RepID=A0A9N9QDD5_9CUCU|nr:unnamed protein product [Ceutorhynchus assimilis]
MNLSNTVFEDDELELLNLGLKYCVRTPLSDIDILKYAVELDVIIEQISNDYNIKKTLRNDIHNVLYNTKKNITKYNLSISTFSLRTLKKLRIKINEQNLIITKADKGCCLRLSSNPHNGFARRTNRILKHFSNFLEQNQAPKVLLSSNPVVPRLYGLPEGCFTIGIGVQMFGNDGGNEGSDLGIDGIDFGIDGIDGIDDGIDGIDDGIEGIDDGIFDGIVLRIMASQVVEETVEIMESPRESPIIDPVEEPVEEFEAILAKVQIPKNIKSLLSYCGWNSVSTFQNISESDIDEMERFARDDLSQLLEGTELKEFFGVFAKKPSLFKLHGGHRQLLRNIKEMCKATSQIKCSKCLSKCKCMCKDLGKHTAGKKRVKNAEKTREKRKKDIEQCTEEPSNVEQDKNNKKGHNFSEAESEEPSGEPQVEPLSHLKLVIGNYIKSFCNKILKDNDEAINIKSKIGNIQLSSDIPTSAKVKCLLCDASIKVSRVAHFKEKNQTENETENQTAKPRSKLKNSTLLDYFHDYRENEGKENNSQTRSQSNLSEGSSFDALFDSNLDNDVACTQTSEASNLIGGEYLEANNELVSEQLAHNDISVMQTLVQPGILPLALPEALPDLENNGNLFFSQGRTSSEAGSAALEKSSENELEKPQKPTKDAKCKWKDEKYSRTQRNLRKLELEVDHQLKITSFFELKDRIVEVLGSNENIERNILKSCADHYEFAELNMNNFLNLLIKHAKQNSSSTAKNNRFTDDLKKFCLYLFIIGGKLNYETLQKNLQNILPSLSSVRRSLNENLSVIEGVVSMCELKNYLVKRKLPLSVFISEDQTAILKKIQYDPKSNKLVGVLLPKDNTGFPVTNKFIVSSIQDIRNAFEKEIITNNAYVFMAQPLKDKVPAFCLCIFGSNNKFSYEDVINRWTFVVTEAHKYGIEIYGFSSDGDTRCLKAMKELWNFPDKSQKNWLSPYFQMEFNLKSPVVIQDTVHILTKMKTRLLNPNITLTMGKHKISSKILAEMIEKFSKDIHCLCQSDLDRDSFSFPRENNARLGGVEDKKNYDLLELAEIEKNIIDAKENAREDANHLGIVVTDEHFSIVHLRENSANEETAGNAEEIIEEIIDSDLEIETSSQALEEEYMSEYDLNELEEDLNTLQDMENLNLRDYSGQNKSCDKSSSYIMVTLKNGKQMTVKKSSICWFFSEKQGRLSTDRLLRVKGMSSATSQPTTRPKRKKKIHHKTAAKRKRTKVTKSKSRLKLNEAETETDTETEYISDKSESSGGEFMVDLATEAPSDTPTTEIETEILIETEKYYSVYYDDQWYLGRILNINGSECNVKFLIKQLDAFVWPKQEDIQLVDKQFIFYGPIDLVGSSPFQLKRVDLNKINKLYKDLKRM